MSKLLNLIRTDHFKDDSLKYVGLNGHPKAEEMYSLAWKNGHEGGLMEVLRHLQDLADMVRNENE